MPVVSSNYFTVIQSVQAVIQTLNLTDWNGNTLPVILHKAAYYRQTVDTAPPIIYVARAHEQEKILAKYFGNVVLVSYPVQISAIAPGNQELNLHQDYYLSWREQIRRTFQAPTLAGASFIYDTDFHPLRNEAGKYIEGNWDLEMLAVEFLSQEVRN